ncbi:MAG: maleylpyruvate isomerase family mycothiol-dependent enzyme [Microthrixaceae bacterium]
MPTFVDKEPLVALLEHEWKAVTELCSELTEAEFMTQSCLPGWTVKDQLSHIAGTELMLNGVAAPQVDISHLSYLRNDVARLVEVWVEDMRSLSGAQVLQVFIDATTERLAALNTMTQEEFDAPCWTPVGADETYGRFMRIRHYDTFMHEHDIREALGRGERADPAAIQSALSEIEPSLGYIVGRKAALPEGSRVRLDLTGQVQRTYFIEVTDRARVVEELSAAASVEVSMPVMLFFRLTGGRCEPIQAVKQQVLLAGDQKLALQLATNMSFTL